MRKYSNVTVSYSVTNKSADADTSPTCFIQHNSAIKLIRILSIVSSIESEQREVFIAASKNISIFKREIFVTIRLLPLRHWSAAACRMLLNKWLCLVLAAFLFLVKTFLSCQSDTKPRCDVTPPPSGHHCLWLTPPVSRPWSHSSDTLATPKYFKYLLQSRDLILTKVSPSIIKPRICFLSEFSCFYQQILVFY